MKKITLAFLAMYFVFSFTNAQPTVTFKILDPSIEIQKIEPAQPVSGQVEKIYFTFYNGNLGPTRSGSVMSAYEGVSTSSMGNELAVTDLGARQSISGVLTILTPKAGESNKIVVAYYEKVAFKKLGVRKKIVAKAELDINIEPAIISKRISGISFFKFAKPDSKDWFGDDNGYLTVIHNPGCGIVGNDGTDQFFVAKGLPPGCKIERAEYTQFWPTVRDCGDPWSWFDDAGSYNAKFNRNNYSIRWHNSCRGAYNGKDVRYIVSFIVSMPEGTDLGETLYDVSSVSPATPGGFSITEAAEPPNCNPRNIGIADISGPFLNVVGPFTLPDRLIEKKPFTISYIFSNSGNQDQPGFDVSLLIDGNPESTKSVAKLSPGQTATLQWNVTKEIEGFTHSFDLDRNPGNISHSQLTFEPAPK